jgi:hypothetical protein
LNIGFIGSIAFSYHEFLSQVAGEEGIRVGRILSSPADGLVEYHFG